MTTPAVAILGPVTPGSGSRTIGGVAVHTEELASALSAAGARTAVLADGLDARPGSSRTDDPWGVTFPVKGTAPLSLAAIAARPGSGMPGIVRRVRADDTRVAAGFPWRRAVTRAFMVRRALDMFGPDVVQAQQPEYRPAFVRWAGGTPRPSVITVHSAEPPANATTATIEVTRTNLLAASMVTAPSETVAARVREQGVDDERIAIVPNAVDTTLFAPLDRAGCRYDLRLDDSPLVLFVGRATRDKGALDLLEAFSRMRETVPEARLVFVGPWETDLAPAPADVTEREPVGLAHGVDRTDVPRWMCAADVVVVPSRHEGFGLTALEAMACGRAVVTSGAGGLSEVVPDEAGVRVATDDPEALAAAITGLLLGADRTAALGRAGRSASLGYSWDSVAQRYLDVYARAIESHAVSAL